MPTNTITVSQLNRYVKAILDENTLLQEIFIKGEISNYTKQYKSGHMYFTLKDDTSSIKCVMFKNYADYLKFTPESGMSVIIRGNVSIYERDGTYQLYAMDMQPDGIGALHLAYEQLKEKLSREGLFSGEFKKPLPKYPEKIGVITSKTGAAVQDIFNVLTRRYPIGEIIFSEVTVQGSNAAGDMVKALEILNQNKACDVIIIGRGGGGIEDLWAFNEEKLVRAVFNSQIPVISAVGHETDFTLCDFAADLRAPTPSAAAELAVPHIDELKNTVDFYSQKIYDSMENTINKGYNKLNAIKNNKSIQSPLFFVEQNRQKLNYLIELKNTLSNKYITERKNELSRIAGLIDSLSPLKVLSRGYSITFKDDKIISSTGEILVGDLITTKLSDGEITSEIIIVDKEQRG